MKIKTRYGRSCLNSMSTPYLLCIRIIFNCCVTAIFACTSCESICVTTVHLPDLDEILMCKNIILDAETSNLPTRKLQQVNAYMYGTRNNFKKDIRPHFNCEIYFGTCFSHLQTGEMPSCGISSGYALFVKVKKISGQKI